MGLIIHLEEFIRTFLESEVGKHGIKKQEKTATILKDNLGWSNQPKLSGALLAYIQSGTLFKEAESARANFMLHRSSAESAFMELKGKPCQSP